MGRPRSVRHPERRTRLRQLILLVEPNAALATQIRVALAACGLEAVTVPALPLDALTYEPAADALLINEQQGDATCPPFEAAGSAARVPVMFYRASRSGSRLTFYLDPRAAPPEPLTVQALGRRIRSRIRPLQAARDTDVLQTGSLRVDSAGHRVYAGGVEVTLTALEFRLLVAILEGQGRVLSRESLLECVWGIRRDVNTRTVDAHVKRLRRKLGPAGNSIETVRGFGYRSTAGDESGPPASREPS